MRDFVPVRTYRAEWSRSSFASIFDLRLFPSVILSGSCWSRRISAKRCSFFVSFKSKAEDTVSEKLHAEKTEQRESRKPLCAISSNRDEVPHLFLYLVAVVTP